MQKNMHFLRKGVFPSMKKQFFLLFLVFLLCGCAQTDAPDTAAPETTAAGTEVLSTEPTVPATEAVELDPVNSHAFQASREKPAVAILDHRTAAFLTTEYPDKDYSRKCTRIRVVDLHMDLLMAEAVLEGTYQPLAYSTVPEHLALASAQTGTVLVLDRWLQEVFSFETQDTDGFLTEDLAEYYYAWGSDLCCLDVASGAVSDVELAQSISIHELLDYSPGENILLASAYAGTYSNEQAMAAIDLNTGEILLLQTGATGGALAEDGVLLETEDLETLSADVRYGNWNEACLWVLPGFLVNDLHFAAWHVDGTDYVCRLTYDQQQNVDIVECELFRMGQTIEVCSLQEALDGAKITQIYALPDGNLLALETSGRGYRTYLICPEQLEFTAASLEAETGEAFTEADDAGAQPPESYELPEKLAEVRASADALEEKYGITVLISGQCTEALNVPDKQITTTNLAGMRDEAASIADALALLDQQLALYPADFFRQFRNEAGERGLLVLLVEDFEGDMNYIGVNWRMGQWYPIAVDITSGEVAKTYCHEIWHATENRIRDLNETALDLENWESCNPAGFGYSGNLTSSYIRDTQYTYFFGNPAEGVYFVDPYAKVNAYEDRARLMEYVMCSDLHAEQMLAYPAMAAKLQILCDAIRTAFDTQNWETVHWERFF